MAPKLQRVASRESVDDEEDTRQILEREFELVASEISDDASDDEVTIDSDDMMCPEVELEQVQVSLAQLVAAANIIRETLGEETTKMMSRVLGDLFHDTLRKGSDEHELMEKFKEKFDIEIEYVE